MRIISGSHKGRQINTPNNLPVRPTTDFAKESLFNILYNYLDFEGLAVLDLFSGTGSMAYEFASRGCSRVWSVENNVRCFKFISENVQKLGFKTIHPVQANVFSFITTHHFPYDIIFADPPYQLANLAEIPEIIFASELLNDKGWLILEHPAQYTFEAHPSFFQHREYGKVNFSFFVNFEKEI